MILHYFYYSGILGCHYSDPGTRAETIKSMNKACIIFVGL